MDAFMMILIAGGGVAALVFLAAVTGRFGKKAQDKAQKAKDDVRGRF